MKKLFALLCLVPLFLVGCGDDDSISGTPEAEETTTEPDYSMQDMYRPDNSPVCEPPAQTDTAAFGDASDIADVDVVIIPVGDKCITCVLVDTQGDGPAPIDCDWDQSDGPNVAEAPR